MFCNENILYLLCSCANPITSEEIDENFLHVDANSHKLKVDQNIFEWAWSAIRIRLVMVS